MSKAKYKSLNNPMTRTALITTAITLALTLFGATKSQKKKKYE